MTPARVILHLNKDYHASYRSARRMAMFKRIEDVVLARGGTVVVAPIPHGRMTAEMARGDGDLHIVEGGNARGTGWLNCSLAYLTGYWTLNPMGLVSIRDLMGKDMAARPPTGPDLPMVPGAAKAFFDGLVRHFAGGRRARHAQPAPRHDLPQGAIAVFLQGPAPERFGQHYLIPPEMIETVARGAEGRPVLVKPHPLFQDQGRELVQEARSHGHDVILAEAHVHDVLAAADVTVSINSAACLEGFLHGKPAILCGIADFSTLAETLLDPDDFPAQLQRALTTVRDYAGWLTWYFTRYAIGLDAADCDDRILAAFAQAGFDAARLGLSHV